MDLNTIITLVAAVVVILAIIIALPVVLRKTNVPIAKYLESSDQMLGMIKNLTAAIPLSQDKSSLVNNIIHWTQVGVQYAEQLYTTGQITDPEKRKETAVTFVENALAQAGHALTDAEKVFVSDVVEGAVFLLPKTHQDATTPIVHGSPINGGKQLASAE